MPDYLDQLVAHWKRQGIGPATSRPSMAEIDAWELHYGVKLPSDLREYFLHLNGVRDGESLAFGDDLMTFLPLTSVVPASVWRKNIDDDRPERFVVADYSISCYWWCAELASEPQAATRILLCGRVVAKSFREFVALYISESMKIHDLGESCPIV